MQGMLRIVVAILFLCHGSQKLFNYPSGPFAGNPLPPLLLAAGIIEFAGGLLLLVGFLTRFAAFIMCGQMAVAYFMAHASAHKGIWPIHNGGELAVVYCFVFLFFAAAGAGKLSIDCCCRRARVENAA
jgi:putative oxidoreductase